MYNKCIAIELFAGAGGTSLGLERAGFEVAIANEIEEEFARTYKYNHPNCIVINKDIKQVDFVAELQELSLYEVSLLSGGPPCQGFSTVGSKNIDDPRNSLFNEYIRAIREIRPLYLLFENVPGFMRLYNGCVYARLMNEIHELGYEAECQILDASDFGLPQRRMRTIVIGWKKGLASVRFPVPDYSDYDGLFCCQKKVTLMEAISDLPALSANQEANAYYSEPRNAYQKTMREGSDRLTEHNCANYGERMKKIISSVPYGGSVEDLPLNLRPKAYFKNTYARLLPDLPAPTITRNFSTPSSSRCIHPYQNRALTTREGARLQGFHDAYLFMGCRVSKNIQIGNALPPVIGEVIGREIIKSLKNVYSSVI